MLEKRESVPGQVTQGVLVVTRFLASLSYDFHEEESRRNAPKGSDEIRLNTWWIGEDGASQPHVPTISG